MKILNHFNFWFVVIGLFVISCVQREKPISEQNVIHPISSEKTQEDTLMDPVFDISYIMGKFDPTQHEDFTLIETQYADREGMLLRKDVYAAFLRMHEAALKEGITLQIRSATRNFDYQKGIWERKWTGETRIESGKDASVSYPDPFDRAKQILLYSSMPGTSRHHWGTDIDLNSFENNWFRSGEGLKLYNWMKEHAHKFGFCQPYTDKKTIQRTGYEEERWHWSFMPISKPLTMHAAKTLRNDMIGGFLGAEVAKSVDMVQNYVLGIDRLCLSSEPL